MPEPHKPAERHRHSRRIDREMSDLPPPEAAAQQHSERLIELIRQRIEEAGGKITFADYMSLALYAPGLGYYAAGNQKFGRGGDFVTAPEISPLFSRCLARQCRDVLCELASAGEPGVILEAGGGSGIMAADILAELERLHTLPQVYQILELSGELRERQRQTIEAKVPHLSHKLQWLDELPASPLRGVILANELLDAMPVHRVRIDAGCKEMYVTWQQERFAWAVDQPSSAELARRIETIAELVGGVHPYESEINPAAEAWIKTVAPLLQAGLMLIIDYGFARGEYYHPQRRSGTLMCHYRHRSHSDPFVYPGLQDITAHVDFTAMAEAAAGAGLNVAGYNTQGCFLLGCGLDSMLAEVDPEDTVRYLRLSQAAKTLTLPGEMGELFKVLALTRNIARPLQGFALQDWRNRL